MVSTMRQSSSRMLTPRKLRSTRLSRVSVATSIAITNSTNHGS